MANEFSLIDKYFKPLGEAIASPNVVLGIGDDCAIVAPRPGHQLVLSSDTLVAGVHFLESTHPDDIGYKSLAVNLSDLAAMGAEPAWFTLCLSLPNQDESWIRSFSGGLASIAHEFHIPLIGGDTTQGPLTITIQVAGWVPDGKALKRSTAQVGDDIFVAGELGWPALGLQSLQQKIQLSNKDAAQAEDRILRPKPQVALAQSLRGLANAAMDISDGLTADLQHMLTASQVGAQIDRQKVPYARGLQAFNEQEQWQSINFGDEYLLLFTASPYKQANIEKISALNNTPIYQIGSIVQTLSLTDETGTVLTPQGYQHF